MLRNYNDSPSVHPYRSVSSGCCVCWSLLFGVCEVCFDGVVNQLPILRATPPKLESLAAVEGNGSCMHIFLHMFWCVHTRLNDVNKFINIYNEGVISIDAPP